jgi:hypothetical protein
MYDCVFNYTFILLSSVTLTFVQYYFKIEIHILLVRHIRLFFYIINSVLLGSDFYTRMLTESKRV